MSQCTRCGWYHACPKCGHVSGEPWGGRTLFERYAGSLAVSSVDLGARVALIAVTELLYENGLNEAAEIVSDHWDRVTTQALSDAAWSEESPASGVNDAAKQPTDRRA